MTSARVTASSQKEVDGYFTPIATAAAMLRLVSQRHVTSIADICAGEGSLLIAANARFPGAQLFAADIARSSTNKVRGLLPETVVSRCNVLRPNSFKRSAIVRQIGGKLSLALLNPPFSCRGGTKYTDRVGKNEMIEGSKAAVILVIAAMLLKDGGELVAVMPASFPSSEKDAAIRRYLCSNGELNFHDKLSRGTFASCSASTVLVHFRRCKATSPQMTDANSELDHFCGMTAQLVRGHVACSRPVASGATKRLFLHTTGLFGTSIRRERRAISGSVRTVRGHVVLIPRVGKPDSFKVTAVTITSPTVLSDCLYALVFERKAHARRAQQSIRLHWEHIAAEFSGTGAPFLTMRNLCRALTRISRLNDGVCLSDTRSDAGLRIPDVAC